MAQQYFGYYLSTLLTLVVLLLLAKHFKMKSLIASLVIATLPPDGSFNNWGCLPHFVNSLAYRLLIYTHSHSPPRTHD